MRLLICRLSNVTPIATLLAAFIVNTGHSQTIRGVITEQDTGTPLPGAFVVLLDSTHLQQGGTLTREDGSYVLRVRAPGHYSLRAELIGHTSVTADLTVLNGTVFDVALPISPILLTSIEAKGRSRCEATRDFDEKTLRLWEDVRKALLITDWGQRTHLFELMGRTYRRTLDPYNLHTIQESIIATIGSRPLYRAIDPDTLASTGYFRRLPNDSLAFYGPDAAVLLSDAFANAHCFRLTSRNNHEVGLIGLSFQPMRGSHIPDVKGTMWLDPASRQLKSVEFTYTGLPKEIGSERPGGQTFFRRLANGAWLVDRWYIRTPLIARRLNGDHVLLAYGETGGEVIDIAEHEQVYHREALFEKAIISGTVFDSIHNRAIPGAAVYLASSSHRARTDSAGVYALEDVPVSEYLIGFWHSTLDSLPIRIAQKLVTVRPGNNRIDLSVPSANTITTTLCGKSHGSIIFGKVPPADGDPKTQPGLYARIAASGSRPPLRQVVPVRDNRYYVCAPSTSVVTLTWGNRSYTVSAAGFIRQDIGTQLRN